MSTPRQFLSMTPAQPTALQLADSELQRFLEATADTTIEIPQGTRAFYAHRSGNETFQYCPRKRYLAYHYKGTGVNLFPPIYFDIGTAVHAGLAWLLTYGKGKFVKPYGPAVKVCPRCGSDWESHSFNVDMCPICADQYSDDTDVAQVAIEAALDFWHQSPVYLNLPEFEQLEQDTLIAGLIWTFYYRAWPVFIAKFEVLMVEAPSADPILFTVDEIECVLWLLSRPDAILRDRKTGDVVALNWKTINDPSDERRENITNSLQINLEAFYAEQLYSTWLDGEYQPTIPKGLKGKGLMTWLDADQRRYKALPRVVAYSQIVYLVKGQRTLSLADGTDLNSEEADAYPDADRVWRQNSFLCYQYVNLGQLQTCPMVRRKGKDIPCCASGAATHGAEHGDDCLATEKQRAKNLPKVHADRSWNHRFYECGKQSYNQLDKGFVKSPVWESEEIPEGFYSAVQAWVHSLNLGVVFPSTRSDEPRNLANPLDKLVLFEEPVNRDRDRQVRFREQVIEREIGIAKSLIRVETAIAEGYHLPDGSPAMFDDLLDVHFPQHLISCRKPTRCEFDKLVCNISQELRRPVEELVQIVQGGVWQRRQPHHAGEREAFDAMGVDS